jgi:hypothetical protein
MKNRLFSKTCAASLLLMGLLASGCPLPENNQNDTSNPANPTPNDPSNPANPTPNDPSNPENPTPNDPSNPANPIAKYNQEFWGEWIGIQGETASIGPQSLTGRTWYISANEIAIDGKKPNSYGSILNNLELSRLSNNVVKVDASGPYEKSVIYLYASRIRNAAFSGSVVDPDGVSPSSRAISGLGNIQVTITNLANAVDSATATTDAAGNFTAANIIAGDTYTVSASAQSAEVMPNVDGDNVGAITIAEGVNFKATIAPTSSTVDMMRLYANGTAYQLNIEIANTGSMDATATTYSIAAKNGLQIVSGAENGILGSIEPGKKKNIPIAVACNSIQDECEFKTIDVRIKDINNKTWDDLVSLRFNKTPVTFFIRSESGKQIQGVVIAPTGKAFPFITSSQYALTYMTQLTLPWSTSDYLVVFCGASTNTETIYSLGINAMPSSKFSEFTDAANYESNDTESSAAVINTQDRIMSYLHKNDFDYYRIKLGPTAPSFKPLVITDYALNDSGYLDIRVLNNKTDASYYAYLHTDVTLSTTSGYVTINKASSRIDVYKGEYATLTSSSYTSEANASLLSGTKSNQDAFNITISNICPPGTDIPFLVTFNKDGEAWTDAFVLRKK